MSNLRTPIAGTDITKILIHDYNHNYYQLDQHRPLNQRRFERSNVKRIVFSTFVAFNGCKSMFILNLMHSGGEVL